ncbi:MAG: 16S rRNA endonuclease CdiA [Catillopecten margaritatus gill symbiont]|uniref:16S rRNA endonuclease CdiA n=1 Tax=Catillopecten margaritatus gill symbiont TaxID=3083288 RepID=A0AAU6PH12_9GAMM
MAFIPLVAYGVPLQTDGSTNTALDKARNNVPIVNIANPNSDGLSHNKFIHYNVGSEGLILNNSKQTNVDTQLGGIIFGNKNLTNNATVILNEVSSTNRSSLKGWTEIAGQKADLIIANPNGLTINGAGFINTNNITLTTGKPIFNNNQFNGLTVNGGDILIEGTGLNARNQDSTNIYSHYLQLNASINAKNLNIKLGQNTINKEGDITQSRHSEQAQNLLLDTSNLGGMYANRITLVGTDKGLGVNLPPEMLASTGDIIINNNGTLSLQKISAKGDIQITSSNDVDVNNNLGS